MGEIIDFFHLPPNEKTFLTGDVLVFQRGDVLFKSAVVTAGIRYAFRFLKASFFYSNLFLCAAPWSNGARVLLPRTISMHLHSTQTSYRQKGGNLFENNRVMSGPSKEFQ